MPYGTYVAKGKAERNKNYQERGLEMTKAERIRALVGNVKNWDWDIFPQFRLEREDAEALQDLEALKEFIAEKERYGGDNM